MDALVTLVTSIQFTRLADGGRKGGGVYTQEGAKDVLVLATINRSDKNKLFVDFLHHVVVMQNLPM